MYILNLNGHGYLSLLFLVPNWIYVNLRFVWMDVSYGTAKSGVGISAMSVLRPDLMMKCVVPVIMAGIIAVSSHWLENVTVVHSHMGKQIYGLVVSVLIAGDCT